MRGGPTSIFMNVRVIVAIMILLTASMFSDINRKDIPAGLPSKLTGIEAFHPDGRLDFFKRARTMKLFLPTNGLASYVTDDPSSIDIASRYLVMQQALAPLYIDRNSLIDRSHLHPFIVGDFREPGGRDRIAQEYDLEPVRDFGDGLIVFRRRR